MNKKELLKGLIKKYVEGKLSEAEEENLFFLIHSKELEDTFFYEQYNLWNEIPGDNKQLQSEQFFNKIKEDLGISDEGSEISGDKITKADYLYFPEICSCIPFCCFSYWYVILSY